jgi:hypothetical protein
MAAQPVYHDEFNDRLDRITAKYMTYINTMQDGLLSQMRVDKRDMQQAIAELRAEMHESVGELNGQIAELLQRHNALEALVISQHRELTDAVTQQRASMDAFARDLQKIVADAFAHHAEETNEKFADVHKILAEIMRRLPPEQQNR